MADDKDIAGQLEIQNQINKVLSQRTKILKSQSKFLSGQTQIAMEMCNALNCEGLEGMSERLEEIQEGLKDASDAAEELESSTNSASNSINKMASKTSKSGGMMSKIFSPLGGTIAGLGVGLKSAFGGATKMMGGFIGSAMRIPGILGKIGMSIISIPFKVLGGLVSMAGNASGGVSALKTAMEDVREEFGSLASNEGKAVMEGFKGMRKQMSDLGGSGIRASKIFGHGSEGLANMLKSVSEQMNELGPLMGQFSGEIKKNAGVFNVYRKGLGLTGEAFASMGKLAASKGKTLNDTLGEVGNQAIQMGKKFGISSKLIAKDMASIGDIAATSAALGTKELASMTVFARKLGIEAKALKGIVDKWDNFEDAAQGASKLSQAFGMNIDAMQMMAEQDPAKRLDHMRQAFFATGKSVEELSRQELKLMASQMGLSEEQAKLALGQEDLSYDEITAGADEAEKKQITQAEAMKELADAMKKVFGSGGKTFNSFMDAFTQGFSKGIMKGKGMRKMLQNIRGSLRETYKFGKDLGKMFIDMFPGIQDMIKGLTDLFSPARFRKLRKDLLGAFRQLFIDLRTDPKGGVETFKKKLSEIFGNFFDGSKGPGKQFMEGFKRFGKTVLLLFMAIIPHLMKGLANMIKKLADFIRDPSAFFNAAKGMGDGLSEALSGAWGDIVDTWPILRDAFYDLWDAVKPGLIKLGKAMWPWIVKVMLVKMMVSVAMNMAGGALLGILAKGFKKLFMGASKKAGPPPAPGDPKKVKKQKTFVNALKEFLRAFKTLKISTIMQAIGKMAVLVVFIGVSLVALAFAVKVAAGQLAGVDPLTMTLMTALLGAVMAFLPGLTAAVKMMSKVGWKELGKGLIKLGIAVAAIGVFALILGGAIAMMPELSAGDIGNFFLTIGVGMAGALAAILVAIPVGMLADKFGAQIAMGLGILAVVMIALAAVGMIIGGMLSVFSNPEGIAAMMEAIATLMLSTAAMLPVAGMLGFMLMAFPFGSAGVAIIIAGFGVLGAIATALVGAVMPAIKEINDMKVENPEKVKMITEAIVSVIMAIAEFTGQFARVLEALKPPPGGAADQMAENIKAAKELLTALLENGINQVINMMIELAKEPNIEGPGLAAVQAIGGVLSAISGIVGAMQPHSGNWEAMMEVIDDDDIPEALAGMERFARTTGEQTRDTIKAISDTFLSKDFITMANDIKGPGLEFIKAIIPMFAVVGDISKAMQPNPEIIKAIAKNIDEDDWEKPFAGMAKFARAIGPQIKSVISSFKPVMVGVIKAVGDMIAKIPATVSADKIAAVAQLLGPVFTALSTMMSGLFPIIQSMIKGATNKQGQLNVNKLNRASTAMQGAFSSIGDMMVKMGPALSQMIKELVKVAGGIDDAEKLKPKIEIIEAALGAIQNLMDMFNPDTSNVFSNFVSGADKVKIYVNGQRVSQIGAAIHNMNNFTDKVLKPGGPLEKLIQAMGNIKISDQQSKNVKKIEPGIKALSAVFEMVKTFKEFDSGPSKNMGDSHKVINGLLKGMAQVNWTRDGNDDENSLQAVLEKIGGGNWKVSVGKINYRTKAIKALTEFATAYTGLNQSAQATTNTSFMGRLGDHSKFLGGMIDKFNTHVEPKMKSKTTRTVNVVKDIVANYNEISKLMNTMNPVEIDAKIDQFGKNLTISKDRIKISNKPINITVELNLTMEADQIALGLSKKAGRKNVVSLSTKNNELQSWQGKT